MRVAVEGGHVAFVDRFLLCMCACETCHVAFVDRFARTLKEPICFLS